jgi:hypothetical protein
MNNAKLDQLLKDYEKDAKRIPLSRRKRFINWVLNEYYKANGRYPARKYLTKMANILLADKLKNKNPDKVSRSKYPILSERQLQVRYNRERSFDSEKLDYFNQKYVKNLSSLWKKRTENIDD